MYMCTYIYLYSDFPYMGILKFSIKLYGVLQYSVLYPISIVHKIFLGIVWMLMFTLNLLFCFLCIYNFNY